MLTICTLEVSCENQGGGNGSSPQSHGNSLIEVSLIVASAIILVILAIPTLQGVVLMNRVPDANDEQTLKKLNLDRSQIEGAITVNVTGKRFLGFRISSVWNRYRK